MRRGRARPLSEVHFLKLALYHASGPYKPRTAQMNVVVVASFPTRPTCVPKTGRYPHRSRSGKLRRH